MEELGAVVRNPVGGLTDPTVFLALLIAAGLAAWSRRRTVRSVVVVFVVAAVAYREQLLYTFLRLVVDRSDLFGDRSHDFMYGLRLMHAYVSATDLYSIGCSILLGALAVVGYRKPKQQDEHANRGERPTAGPQVGADVPE